MDSKKSKKTKATPKATSKTVVKKIATTKVSFGRRLLNRLRTSKRKIILTVAWVAAFLVALALVDLFVQYENNDASVAVVNGDRIYKSDFDSRLSADYGQSSLQQMILEKLAYTAAAKENITVSNQEVDTFIKRFFEDRYGSRAKYLDALKQSLKSEESDRINAKLAILDSKKFPYTETELKTFFTTYKDYFLQSDPKATYDTAKLQVEYTYIQYDITYGKFAEWISGLNTAATVQNNLDATSKPSYGLFKQTINIINGLLKKK
jgi:hypothetical protein